MTKKEVLGIPFDYLEEDATGGVFEQKIPW